MAEHWMTALERRISNLEDRVRVLENSPAAEIQDTPADTPPADTPADTPPADNPDAPATPADSVPPEPAQSSKKKRGR